MELLLHQVLAGLATGGIYACLALALVMIYQAIDHLNFAQGEMAMFSTFIAWQLIELGVPYWVAFVATLVISFVAGVLIDRVLFRPIHDAPILSHIVVFIALFDNLQRRRDDRRDDPAAGVSLCFLPPHPDRPGDAGRGREPAIGAACRHPG